MLSSISPVGEASRQQRWWVTATAYTVASAAGGALLGAVVGGVGGLLGVAATTGWSVGVLLLALLLGAGADARRLPLTPPRWRRQVDERWLTTYRGWVYGVGYGAQLGLGVATIVPTAAIYVLLVAAVLTGGMLPGATIGAAFGAARAVPLLLMAPVRTPAALRGAHRRLDAAGPWAHRATVLAQLSLAMVAAGVLAGLTGR